MTSQYEQALSWEKEFGVGYAFNRVLDFLREPTPITHVEIKKGDVMSINGVEYIVTDILTDQITKRLQLQTKYEPSVDIGIRYV